ncbi:type 2 isopentenyl-diphosphate Delta-isomerase [uncultured Ruegeria sp.]|uniref:type 2 isopentenyl-diphosphate Delta-isomerase n=1 Tax=uncultured Ruegeria sp. TaxID=259304 RepID=UPI00263726E4|nr:type 2 isopentenyl-diphosphate Delta-isomerase [uncultured Ruegeria sp.]
MTDHLPDRSVSGRKHDHLSIIAKDTGVERHTGDFSSLRLCHRAMPELNLDDIQTQVGFLGKRLSFPLLISSMTGGEGENLRTINKNLAEAAEATEVAMAVGSQRVMFTNNHARSSFELREFAPKTVLISNMGAVQLNTGIGLEECTEAVEVLGADGLYLHLNPLQEAVQPEGDRDFSGLGAAIAELVPDLPVPVLLKEVGSGLSAPDIRLGLDAGIRHFDVAGRGGTSWSRIEYHRRASESDDLGLVFQDWGLTTIEALRAARPILKSSQQKTTLIASGGIRSGIDIAKSIILGADLCGLAAPFLSAAQISRDAVIDKIEQLKREFRTAMFLLGCADCADLKKNGRFLK